MYSTSRHFHFERIAISGILPQGLRARRRSRNPNKSVATPPPPTVSRLDARLDVHGVPDERFMDSAWFMNPRQGSISLWSFLVPP